MICVNIYMINCVWNTRVGKHDLRGSENKVNMKILEIELNRISGWQLAPLRRKMG